MKKASLKITSSSSGSSSGLLLSYKSPDNNWQTQQSATTAADGSLATIYFGGARTPNNISNVEADTSVVYATSGSAIDSEVVGGGAIIPITAGTLSGGNVLPSQTIGGITTIPNVIFVGSSSDIGKISWPRTAGISYEYDFWLNARVDATPSSYQNLFGIASVTTVGVVGDLHTAGGVNFVAIRNNSNTSIRFYKSGVTTDVAVNNIQGWNHYKVGIYFTSGTTYQVRVYQNNVLLYSTSIEGTNPFAIGGFGTTAHTYQLGTQWVENMRIRIGVTDSGEVDIISTNTDKIFSTSTALSSPSRTQFWDNIFLSKRELWLKEAGAWGRVATQ